MEDKYKAIIDELTLKFKEIKAHVLAFTKKATIQLGTAVTKDGVILAFEGEALIPGLAVTIEDESKEQKPAPDAAYELESGDVVTIKDGKVEALDKLPAPTEGQITRQEYEKVEKELGEVKTAFAALELKFTQLAESHSSVTEVTEKTLELFTAFSKETPAPSTPPANRKMDLADKQAERLKLIEDEYKNLIKK